MASQLSDDVKILHPITGAVESARCSTTIVTIELTGKELLVEVRHDGSLVRA
jgi:hypothetical protein